MTLKYAQESFKYYDTDIKNKIAANSMMAMVYSDWGQHSNSLVYLYEALKYTEELGDKKQIAQTLRTIADINPYSNNSLKQYLRALTLDEQIGFKEGIIQDLIALSGYYRVSNELSKSEEYINRANNLAGNDRNGEYSLQINEGLGLLAMANGHYDKAIAIFISELVKYDNDPRKAQRFCDYIGRIYYTKGDYYLSEEYTEKAISFIEILRNSMVRERKTVSYVQMKFLYEILISSRINLENIIGAFNVSELITARTLSEIITEDSNNIVQNISLVQSHLNSNQAMIVFPCNTTSWFKTNKKINALVITDDSIFGYEDSLPDSTNIVILFKTYRNAISQGVWDKRTMDKSKSLYSILIEPLKHYLKSKNDLIIVPGGLYSLLPFESLIDEDGHFFVENQSIRYIQSAGIWNRLSEKKDNNWEKELLAFGGAQYEINNSYLNDDIVQWENLDFSEEEVNTLGHLFDSDVYTGKTVTENNVKQIFDSSSINKYKMVHFATHGEINYENPEHSAIVLSQGDDLNTAEDGYFCVDEIAERSTQIDFLNLSACYTGAGTEVMGEGMFGLVWAFMAAGVNSVNASLWSIQDKATTVYMESLYKKIKSGINYGDANVLTKREFISGNYGEIYKNPYYWSSYIYYGH